MSPPRMTPMKLHHIIYLILLTHSASLIACNCFARKILPKELFSTSKK